MNALFQGMDCFLLPSRFERLGIVGIEAQAAGVPCIFSTKVSREIDITTNVFLFQLKIKKNGYIEL